MAKKDIQLVLIAKIVAVHGIRGLVKIKSFTSPTSNIKNYSVVYNHDASTKYKITSINAHKNTFLASIAGINSRSNAESLVGVKLYALKSQLPSLAEQEFFHHDLLGLDVKHKNKVIGKITAIYNFGANDIIQVLLFSGKEIMIDFSSNYVPEVNIESGYINVENFS